MSISKILSIAALLIITSCQSRETVHTEKFKTMMIKSSGEVEVMPDEASFTIHLSCLNKSIQLSKVCLVTKSNELTEALLKHGIDKDNIQTTGVDLQKSYTWNRNSRVFEGYRSSTTVYISVNALDNLDDVYTTLLNDENLEIGGLSYTHSQMDSLKNEAYLSALKKSNILANKLLIELPESEMEILKIGNVEISSSTPELRQTADAEVQEQSYAGANRSIAVNKGMVSIQATLFVEYLIE